MACAAGSIIGPIERANSTLDDCLIAPGALFLAVHRPTTLTRIDFAISQGARY